MQLIGLYLLAFVFFVALMVVFTSFGSFLLEKIYKKSTYNPLQHFVLANLLTFSFVGTGFFIFGNILQTYVYYFWYIFVIVALISFLKNKHIILNFIMYLWQDKKIFIFGLLSTFMFASTLAGSWIETSEGLYIQSGQLHDSAWHLAVINNLLEAIPPAHPSSYEIQLTHYHYFYDIIIASLEKAFAVPAHVIYFQVMPFYLALLLFLSALVLAEKLKSKTALYILPFLTFFGGGFTYLLPLFISEHHANESSFWVSQTFAMMLNPQLIYSFALVFTSSFLIHELLRQNTLKLSEHFILIFLIITSIGFKSYSYIVLLMLYGLTLVLLYIKHKNNNYIFLGLITFLLSIPLYLMVVGSNGSGTFFYKPLWFVDTMIEIPDRLHLKRLLNLEAKYKFNNDLFRLTLLKMFEVCIFYVGNLGTRVICIVLPIFIFFKSKNENRSFILIIVLSCILTSVFPLLFLQKGIVWNSIQFWYYSLIFANILATITVVYCLNIIKKQRVAYTIFIFLFIVLSVIPFLQTIPKKIVTFQLIKKDILTSFNNLNKNSAVLVCLEADDFYNTSFITAYTKAKVFFSDTPQLELTGYQNVTATEQFLKSLLHGSDSSALEAFIREKDITNIICAKEVKGPERLPLIDTINVR